MQNEGTEIHFLNIQYFFRLLYDLFTGASGGGSGAIDIVGFFAQVWIVVSLLSFLVCAGALFVLIHSTIRLYRIKAEDAPNYATQHAEHVEVKRDHSRWSHVMQLIESANESDWRQAIIEADIMLDDLLSQLGYAGTSVGEKLRAADPARFATLQQAWEAHKVRNEIAHQGSAYPLTDQLAYRTIQQYENVMREHGEI